LAILLARFLGPQDYGVLAGVLAFTALFMMATDLGFEQEMLRRSRHAEAGEILTLTMASIGVTLLATLLGLGLVIRFFPSLVWPASLVALAMGVHIVNRFALPFRYLCLALGRTHVPAIVQSVSTAALVASTLAVLALGGPVSTILSVHIAIGAVTLLVWDQWRRSSHVRLAGSLSVPWLARVGRYLQQSLPFALTNLLWVAYFNVDLIILSALRSNVEVGEYSGVYRLVAMTFILGSSIASSFTPALFAAAGTAEHAATTRRLMRLLVSTGALVALVFVLFAPWFLSVIMGAAYVEAAPLARVLGVAAFFRMINFGWSTALTTAGRHNTRIAVETALLVLNVVLNLLLIPALGAMGSAIAALGAELMLTGAGWLLWRRSATESRRAA
jgi:O-antigen/teichoic acid export membrane protein